MVRNIVIRLLLIAAIASVGRGHLIGAEPAAPAQQPPRPTTHNTASQENGKLLAEKIAERDRLQREIDELRRTAGMPQQILVKIRAIEVNRSKLRRLGVDWTTADGKQKSVSSVAELLQPNASSSLDAMKFGIVGPGGGFHGFLQAMETNNIAKVLAEPSIVIVSGRPATFHVGGEFPMPAAPDSGKLVEFVNFGTQVDMLASWLGNDKVRMELRVRVSEPDYSRSITIEGQSVPTFNVRQCDTAFELPVGQSAVFTGLIQRREAVVIGIDGQRQSDTEEIETLFIAIPESIDSLDVATAYEPPAAVK